MTRRRSALSLLPHRGGLRPATLGASLILAGALVLAVSVARAGGNLETVVNDGTAIAPIAWDDLARSPGMTWRSRSPGR
jgi:hypothetical protein